MVCLFVMFLCLCVLVVECPFFVHLFLLKPGSSPGCSGKFPEIWLSLLWIHWEIPGSAGELTEKARDLPEYRDELPGISPVNFQFPIYIYIEYIFREMTANRQQCYCNKLLLLSYANSASNPT